MSENKTARTPTDDGQPVAWTPQVWRQFRPDGTLEFQKIKRTPNGEWEDYTAPPKRDLTCVCGAVWEGEMMVHPPRKREWVGLTDEEIDYQAKKDDHAVYFALGALWAEAKLKEKNHG